HRLNPSHTLLLSPLLMPDANPHIFLIPVLTQRVTADNARWPGISILPSHCKAFSSFSLRLRYITACSLECWIRSPPDLRTTPTRRILLHMSISCRPRVVGCTEQMSPVTFICNVVRLYGALPI